MDESAIQHLANADPILGELISKVGPCLLCPDAARSPFQALVQAVAHQQLHGKAATTILGRFVALFPAPGFPSPQQVLETELSTLTGVGFSRAKAQYVKEIARMTVEGVVPDKVEIARLTDEEIVERLTQIRGVGRWTVEMLLIFSLGRPDVLPVDDFGVRSGFAIAFKKRKPPKAELVRKHGQRWKPYRSIAAWYLWRAVDLAKASPK